LRIKVFYQGNQGALRVLLRMFGVLLHDEEGEMADIEVDGNDPTECRLVLLPQTREVHPPQQVPVNVRHKVPNPSHQEAHFFWLGQRKSKTERRTKEEDTGERILGWVT